jgi:hypothetical protein
MKLIAELQSSPKHAQATLFTDDGSEMIKVSLDPVVKV